MGVRGRGRARAAARRRPHPDGRLRAATAWPSSSRDEPSRTVAVRFTTGDGQQGSIALVAVARVRGGARTGRLRRDPVHRRASPRSKRARAPIGEQAVDRPRHRGRVRDRPRRPQPTRADGADLAVVPAARRQRAPRLPRAAGQLDRSRRQRRRPRRPTAAAPVERRAAQPRRPRARRTCSPTSRWASPPSSAAAA